MANTYFQFKQFRVEQGKAAMKVCTDSCAFGALVEVENAHSCLDIGTGTGLLALMLAQKGIPLIDAVEVDEDAFFQAKENFTTSPWPTSITCIHDKIQSFAEQTTKKYDLVISNPPFFSNSLKSADERVNLASHSTQLSLDELILSVDKVLAPNGKFWVLLPSHESDFIREEGLKKGLYVSSITQLKDTEKASVFREVTCFSRSLEIPKVELLILKNENNYTAEFIRLLEPYYLHL